MADDLPPDDEEPYAVGYGKPPLHSRFKTGQSGNPKGRSKGAKSIKTELREELSELVSITVDGKVQRIPKRRLIIKALATKAAKGDVRAAEKLIAMIIEFESFDEQPAAAKPLSSTDQLMLDRLLGLEEESKPDGNANEHDGKGEGA